MRRRGVGGDSTRLLTNFASLPWRLAVSQFGTGATTIRTTQDLMVFPGLAPMVREGDSSALKSPCAIRRISDGCDDRFSV
jgi:hypothetical protein